MNNPDFSTLVTAIKAAGLVETLSGVGPFTVFAPTNAAFAKIPEATLTALLADKTKLTSILTYHVVAGKVMAKDVVDMTEAQTVEGTKVNISSASEVAVEETVMPEMDVVEVNELSGIMVNDANITRVDIECSNGVIHVIDTVLML